MMVMLTVCVVVCPRMTREIVGMVDNPWVLVVVAVAMVVVGSPVAIVAALLKLLLDVRGRWVPMSCSANQGFHGVLRCQAQRLRVNLLRIAAAGHPVELLQVVLLFCWAETRRGRYRAAGRADRGGRHRALGLESVALPNVGAFESREGLLLHVELHQIKVIDIFHC